MAEKSLIVKFIEDASPMTNPKDRSIPGNIFWSLLTGFAAYICIRDGFLISGWWLVVAPIILLAMGTNIFYIIQKIKNK